MMYSPETKDHFYHPRNSGPMADPDSVGRGGAPFGQGNFMVIYLRFSADGLEVQDARFQTYGCPSAISCGSWVSEWLPGKSIAEAATLTASSISDGLGGLAVGREHCAKLAIDALTDALDKRPSPLSATDERNT